MKTFLKIVLLGGLLSTWVHAETLERNLPALDGGSKIMSNDNLAVEDKDAQCTRCHDETENKPILSIYQTPHGNRGDSRTPFCQSCHGESEQHIKGSSDGGSRPAPDILFGTMEASSDSYASSEPEEQNKACLSCHEQDARRTHWDGGAHQTADVACASCHETHVPRDRVRNHTTQAAVCFTCHQEQRAQSHKFSRHPITEGKVVCSDCHNPHGSTGPKLLVKNTVNETCFTCHAEKRGPFLWEHQPVTEDCANCHNPHGSNMTPLLKSRPPFLCQECHDGPHHSDDPVGLSAAGMQAGGIGGTNGVSENYTGRACLNCHSLVHGSNHPAGALLQR